MLIKGGDLFRNKFGQVTVFIIIAIILVAGIVLFLVFRDNLSSSNVPASIDPAYTSFLACLESDLEVGIDVLSSQGGYIELPELELGSSYMPFSSQLNFLGNSIPYWYYVSGNNLQREQVPSRSEMESQLEGFIEEKIFECDFDNYHDEGFEISYGGVEPKAKVSIRNNEVEVDLGINLEMIKGEDSALINSHKMIVKSDLGELYDSARQIYDIEQDNLFLENYAIDTLRLYAPVDGVEIQCSPKIWQADEVFDQLEDAIEVNTLALRTGGKSDDYFNVDLPLKGDVNVRFINSKNWPSSFEVSPAEESILISNPVGNQQGLGIMGFCYVPYHFVYDIKYPVLVQIYSGEDLTDSEVFQFPLAVVIRGNKPREPLDVSAVEIELPELCKYKNSVVEVQTYDTSLNPIEAEISYECFGTQCSIGETSLASPLEGEFPQCVNGYVLAKSEGFEDAKYLYSTTEGGNLEIIMDKSYELEIDLKLDGRSSSQESIISFISDTNSKTIAYPEQKMIELSEGQYEIQVQVYRNSTLTLAATNKESCVEVPQSGLGGILRLTKDECFTIEIPEQLVSSALTGGGQENFYILEDDLRGSEIIEINTLSLPVPTSIEQLQLNHILFEEGDLDISFI